MKISALTTCDLDDLRKKIHSHDRLVTDFKSQVESKKHETKYYDRWTSEEIKFLRDQAGFLPKRIICVSLGRSYWSVKKKIQRLGIDWTEPCPK